MWLTTWPLHGKPQYAEHDTESQAAAHAHELVRSGRTDTATFFEIEGLEISA